MTAKAGLSWGPPFLLPAFAAVLAAAPPPRYAYRMNPALLLTFAGGLLLTGGDLFMRDWVAKNDWRLFAAGMSLYVGGLVALSFSYRYENIAVASLILVVFNVTTLLIVNYLWFGQGISLTRLGAMAAALLAVTVLEVAK